MFKLQPFKFENAGSTGIYKFIKKFPLQAAVLMLFAAMFVHPHEAKAVECDESVAISAGTYHTVGLREDGSVIAVGDNSRGQTNVSNWMGMKAVSAGVFHTVGLRRTAVLLPSEITITAKETCQSGRV
ncbi:MAG: RCC1 domain-containing protein [bacterium]|nr:RCC1 domain-containing protein [bacterium]